MNLTFRNAPINEVVLGMSFMPRPDFRVPHFGAFWAEIADRYPAVDHAPPLGESDGTVFVDTSGLPLPRVWFVAPDDTSLVQLQQDRLYYNWRRRAAAQEYPRFAPIQQEFFRVKETFEKFFSERFNDKLLPFRYELTYVNIIEAGQGWSEFSDAGEIFKDLASTSLKCAGLTLQSIVLQSEYKLEPGPGTLRIQVQPLVKDGMKAYKLELSASTPSVIGADIDYGKWYEQSHLAIISAFKQITTTKMHQIWGLEE